MRVRWVKEGLSNSLSGYSRLPQFQRGGGPEVGLRGVYRPYLVVLSIWENRRWTPLGNPVHVIGYCSTSGMGEGGLVGVFLATGRKV